MELQKYVRMYWLRHAIYCLIFSIPVWLLGLKLFGWNAMSDFYLNIKNVRLTWTYIGIEFFRTSSWGLVATAIICLVFSALCIPREIDKKSC